MYIEPLIGANSINTMPAKTIAAFADRGRVASTLQKGVTAAARTLQNLRSLHINLDHVAEQLESEGIQKFRKAYDETLRVIEEKRSRQSEMHQAASLSVDTIARAARQLRRDVIRMTTAAGSGHPTSCMSAAEIVAALFFEHMRWDPADPRARNVDSFLLSKGHAAPILWAALAGAGAIKEDLLTLRDFNSTLEGHPTPTNPWVKVATGSLGQGLCAANGIALANRLDGVDARVYCLLGDGECSEGSVWEAAQFAALNKLANVVAIVDQNALGQSAPAPLRDRPNVLAERFRAFGWHALEIDGHDLRAVREALGTTSKESPTAIIAHTVKGKGVSFIAGREGWHGKPLDREESARALHELGPDEHYPAIEARRIGPAISIAPLRITHIEPKYDPGEKIASRKAFGQALATLGAQLPQLVVLDADVMNSTYTELFAKQFPERFFESHIAEQNMVGAGLGLAVSGKIPVVATFACFLTRAHDFIRMAAHSRPEHLVFCGSHAGVSIGEDGPSQMGLEDIAMFRALGNSTVLCPSDAVSAQRLTELAVRTPGIVYIRTARPATALLYEANDEFTVGGSKTLRSSQEDRLTLVATGIAVYSALSAHDQLRQQGVMARVIDAYSIKPLDVETLMQAARETERIVVIEDHWIDGGLGDAVAAALSGTALVQRLGVMEEPHSGTMEELLEHHHISAHAICEKVMARATH
jgi:transketolase